MNNVLDSNFNLTYTHISKNYEEGEDYKENYEGGEDYEEKYGGTVGILNLLNEQYSNEVWFDGVAQQLADFLDNIFNINGRDYEFKLELYKEYYSSKTISANTEVTGNSDIYQRIFQVGWPCGGDCDYC